MAFDIFKMVALADLHFGHPKVDAESLYKKLRKYMYPELRDAHLCVICGDIYDQLLTVSSTSYKYVALFISDLFVISAKTGLQIRILHGTFTHDRDQLSIFNTIRIPNSRFKIINTVDCEEIMSFQNGVEILEMPLRIGYIPDNLTYKRSDEVVDHLKRSMTCLGWKTLDLLIGHGSFEHVFIGNDLKKPPCLYSHKQFEKLVTGIIVMGHIHNPGKRYNIYYCGSFDRIAHGEEEDKGFYTFTRDKKNQEGWMYRFIINQDSTPFITIEPQGDDIPAIANDFLKQMESKFSKTKRGYVRVIHNNPEVRSLLHRLCIQQYPEIGYTSKGLKDSNTAEAIKIEDITFDAFDDVIPDEHNLGDLVYQFLLENNLVENISQESIVTATNSLISDKSL